MTTGEIIIAVIGDGVGIVGIAIGTTIGQVIGEIGVGAVTGGVIITTTGTTRL